MSRMENVAIAKENMEYMLAGHYIKARKEIPFKLSNEEMLEVEVFSPERIEQIKDMYKEVHIDHNSRLLINVTNCDTLKAAYNLYKKDKRNVLVMNFANATHAGGGYLTGSVAQEECLCRQSTLYASISSKKAQEMYSFNDKKRLPFDSDYMLLSKNVEVFRDSNNELLDKSFVTSVLTIPAPNLFGRAADETQEDIDLMMKHRIRNFFTVAIEFGYKHLVLGAWGCGAFGHDARKVAGYFKQLLFEDGFKDYFDTIEFAVLDTTYTKYNYHSFLEVFSTQYAF